MVGSNSHQLDMGPICCYFDHRGDTDQQGNLVPTVRNTVVPSVLIRGRSAVVRGCSAIVSRASGGIYIVKVWSPNKQTNKLKQWTKEWPLMAAETNALITTGAVPVESEVVGVVEAVPGEGIMTSKHDCSRGRDGWTEMSLEFQVTTTLLILAPAEVV